MIVNTGHLRKNMLHRCTIPAIAVPHVTALNICWDGNRIVVEDSGGLVTWSESETFTGSRSG